MGFTLVSMRPQAIVACTEILFFDGNPGGPGPSSAALLSLPKYKTCFMH